MFPLFDIYYSCSYYNSIPARRNLQIVFKIRSKATNLYIKMCNTVKVPFHRMGRRKQ